MQRLASTDRREEIIPGPAIPLPSSVLLPNRTTSPTHPPRRLPLFIAIKHNIPGVLNELTLREIPIDRAVCVRPVRAVVRAEDLLDGFRCHWGVVYQRHVSLACPGGKEGARTERHLRKEMMRDMIMADIMQEIPSRPAQEGSVDCAGCASEEGPCAFAEMWERWVCVLQLITEHQGAGARKVGEGRRKEETREG